MIQLFQSSYIRWYKNDFTLCVCDDNVLKMYRIKVRIYCIVISLYLVCVPYLYAKCMHVCIRDHGFSLGIHFVCCAYVMIIYLKSTVKVRREYSY